MGAILEDITLIGVPTSCAAPICASPLRFVIRDLLGHHSVTLTEKYYAHLAPSSLASAVQRLNKKKENLLPKLLLKTDFAPFSGIKNGEGEVPLTASFERCYVPEVSLLAGVAKLAYAADSKSAGVHSPWGFKSLLRHSHRTTYDL